MKKIIALLMVMGFISASAMACPKGETLVGGTGPHHKGGECVAKSEAAKAANKAEKNIDKAADKADKATDKAVDKVEKSTDKAVDKVEKSTDKAVDKTVDKATKKAKSSL